MRPTDPLSLAVSGWVILPVARGTLTFRLSAWYGHWVADVETFTPEE